MVNKIYLEMPKAKKVENKVVTVKDAVSVWCADDKVRNRVCSLKLYDFKDNDENRIIISMLKVIETVQKEIENAEIIPTGETDMIIELNTRKTPSPFREYAKVALVSFIIFFGAAFTIMAFNNEVGVHGVFVRLYRLITGKESDGMTILEYSYSIGLAVGIIVFYDHFGKKRLSKDPTPIEVEMRLYEDDINTTLIEGVKRKDKHIDVD